MQPSLLFLILWSLLTFHKTVGWLYSPITIVIDGNSRSRRRLRRQWSGCCECCSKTQPHDQESSTSTIALSDASTNRRRRLVAHALQFPSFVSILPPVLCLETKAEEPVECRDGAIVSETAVPGAYQQQCMTLPQRSVPLKSTGQVISVVQGSSVGAGQTGVAVWNSCLLLTRLLDTMSSKTSPSWLHSKTVVELGCGTGLASIAAAKLGAANVLATDGNVDVVLLAQENAVRNHVNDTVEAKLLPWGFMNAMDIAEVADVVIGSDLTYNSGTWRVLAETISTILKPGGIVVYLTLGHAGFNVQGELDGFLSVVQSEGLQLVPTEGSNAPPPFRNIAQKLLESLTAEEQSVLDSTGGARVIVLQKSIGNQRFA